MITLGRGEGETSSRRVVSCRSSVLWALLSPTLSKLWIECIANLSFALGIQSVRITAAEYIFR